MSATTTDIDQQLVPCKNQELYTKLLTLILKGFFVLILCAKLEAEMAYFGYARVSTSGQSLTAQLAELKGANCARIYQEKISLTPMDRSKPSMLISVLDKGDVLVGTR